MNMNISVKKVGIGDLPLLIEWRMRVLHEVFADYSDAAWDSIRLNNEKYYAEHLTDNTHTACFAFDADGGIAGCGGICYYEEMPSPDNLSGACGYLMNIFTVPEMRGNGIGRKIAEFLIADAKERNTAKIYLESSEAAKGLYECMGFRPMRDYYKL